MGALALLVAAELARQALGPEALLIIDNVVRHEAPPPRAAPAIVRELLARPLDAADASALFRKVVPEPLKALQPGKNPAAFDALLQTYVKELAAAQRALLAATGKLDETPLLEALKDGLPSADRFLAVANAVDAAGIERANALLIEATARFMTGLDRHASI